MHKLVATIRRSALSGHFATAFLTRFGSAILGFVTLLTASRLLSTYEYGVYVFLFSIGSGLGLVAVLGQHNLLLKHYRMEGTAAGANGVLVRHNLVWLGRALALLLGVGAVVVVAEQSLPDPYDRLHLAFAFAAVFAVSEYLQNLFRIHRRFALALLPREIVWRGGCAAVLCLGSIAGILYGATEAMELVLALLVAATAFQAVHLARLHGPDLRPGGARAAPEERAAWRSQSLFFTANNALHAVSLYLETVIVGAVLGMEEAAFYFVALRYATLLLLPVAAIDTVGLPMVAARIQAADWSGLQRLISRLSLASFLISVVGALGMLVVGPYALALFKPDFVAHLDVLLVLCISSVAAAFFGPGVSLLMIGGGERFLLVSNAVLFSIYGLVLCGLADVLGIVGVACANLALTLGYNLLVVVWVRRRWGIDNMATSILWSLPGTRGRRAPEAAPRAPVQVKAQVAAQAAPHAAG
ncbi:lipopolysaccharide biosynthesis protein [Methylobacterium radiodurans]|nr:oligosaccharide flippase family protein [Methylobacterium radiodurans]